MKIHLEYDQVKSDIVEASREVFMKYGFAKVSMQDISKASSKGRTTLYYYFKNKGEVLKAFAAEEFKSMLSCSQKNLHSAKGFVYNIESYYKHKLQIYKAKLVKYNMLIEDIKAEPTLYIKENKLFFEEESAIIKQIIGWAIEQKELQVLSEEDLNFLSDTLVTAFRSFEQEMILFGGLEDFETKLAWLAQILYKGLK